MSHRDGLLTVTMVLFKGFLFSNILSYVSISQRVEFVNYEQIIDLMYQAFKNSSFKLFSPYFTIINNVSEIIKKLRHKKF